MPGKRLLPPAVGTERLRLRPVRTSDAALVEEAFAAARTFLPADEVRLAREPMTGSEDFARFLDHVPGCFAFLGNGRDSPPLHNSRYDFNDDLLAIGVTYWVRLAEKFLRAQ